MTKQRESKNTSIIFLIALVLNIALVPLSIFMARQGKILGIWATVLAEAAIFIPLVIYLKMKNEPFFSTLGFHKIKVSTVFLTILLNIVITPIWMFGNFFSQLFVPNIAGEGITNMVESSAGAAMLVISLLPPLFEEMLFRGLLFNKYRKVSTILKAALLSGLFFGLIHLNLNQFCYAFLLGVIFAFVNVASGSIVTSMILHFLINGFNVLLLYVSLLAQQVADPAAVEAQAAALNSKSAQLTRVGVCFVLAIIASFIAHKIMQAIAKKEGHLEEYNSIFKKNESKETAHIFRTSPAILSTVIGFAFVIYLSFFMTGVF